MTISTLKIANYANVNDHGTTINGSVLMSPMNTFGLSSMGIKASGSPNFYVPMAIDMGYSSYGTTSYASMGSANFQEPFPSITYTPKSRWGVLTGTFSYPGTIGSPGAFSSTEIGVGVSGDNTRTNMFTQFWSGAMNGVNASPYAISLVVDFSTIQTNLVTIKLRCDQTLTLTLTNFNIRWMGPGYFY
jgi:hypothetical protein